MSSIDAAKTPVKMMPSNSTSGFDQRNLEDSNMSESSIPVTR
jgi:hypothetical protein